jgi:hypothetical protein
MITKERLWEKFDYLDGVLYHKTTWGPIKAGDVAGTKNPRGYIIVRFDGKPYLAHRIIFFMYHGYFPQEIDHINRVKHDNRIENLRAVCRIENARNKGVYKTNCSGNRNVSLLKTGKYEVSLRVNGRRMYVGVFDDPEFAGLVAEEARSKYHSNIPVLKARLDAANI